MTAKFVAFFSPLWDWIDQRGIVRRIVLALALWMTWRVTTWSMAYADTTDRDGMQAAALLVAVQAPVTLFCSTVFKAYIEGRQ